MNNTSENDTDRWRYIVQTFRQMEALANNIVTNANVVSPELAQLYAQMLNNLRENRIRAERMAARYNDSKEPRPAPRN